MDGGRHRFWIFTARGKYLLLYLKTYLILDNLRFFSSHLFKAQFTDFGATMTL